MSKLAAPPLPTLSFAAPHVGSIPMLGLGTWPLTGRQAYEIVSTALEMGYRHIDTATMYGNQAEIGAAVADSGLRREEVFLTTKIPSDHHGKELDTLSQSLTALGVDWVDLWLLHSPPEPEHLVGMWEQMIHAQKNGLAMAVGVSNFTSEQIEHISSTTGVSPAVNQVSWSPQRFDQHLLDHAREHKIVLQGYSPFRHGSLDEPVVTQIAQRHHVSPAQVVLRWHLDEDVVAIPRSVRYEHLAANLEVTSFSLDPDEVEQLNALGQANLSKQS